MKRAILYTISFVLLISSCSDRFFEMYPSNNVMGDKYYNTQEDYNGALVACYERFRGLVGLYTNTLEYRGDHMCISAPTAGSQDIYDIDQFRDNSANGIIEGHWNHLYNFVFRCNMILQDIDSADIDKDVRDRFKAEALFMRSWCFFELCRCWGGVAMPLKAVSIEEALGLRRESAEAMFERITEDLKFAAAHLPEAYDRKNVGRATNVAATALLGRVYMHFGKFSETVAVLAPIADLSKLLPSTAAVFDVKNKNNMEIIFSVRYNNDIPSHGHGIWFHATNPDVAENPPASLRTIYAPMDARLKLLDYTQVGAGQYILNKYYDTLHSSYKNVNNDYILLRYADVILMYAEALNETAFDSTDASTALKMLNAIRQRSNLAPLSAGELPSQDAVRKEIWMERQRELVYEGQRWFDLVRTNQAAEVMEAMRHKITRNEYLFPIPLAELDRIQDESLLWQNPGY